MKRWWFIRVTREIWSSVQKSRTFLQWQQTFSPFAPSWVSVYICAPFSICALITLQTQPCRENKCCLSSLQLCQQWYLIQTGGSESLVVGWGGGIKTLCLNEALVQLGSSLEHRTCIFLSNFLSGKVRESWTGGDVGKSQESIRSDWKCLLELHHCALFQHDPSPTEMQVHTWTLALSIENGDKQSTCDFSGLGYWYYQKKLLFGSVLCIKVVWHFILYKKERGRQKEGKKKKMNSEDNSWNIELNGRRQR